MMKILSRNKSKQSYSYQEFLVLFPCCGDAQQREFIAQLDRAEKPLAVGKYAVPDNLNAISYGLLDDVSTASQAEDPIVETISMLLGMSREEVLQSDVIEVFGFANFVKRELERINSHFSSIKVRYNSEEIAAGVKDLDFGSFGVLDWYARRMGIINQNDVRNVAWVRIYNCMRNDAEQNNYERRLHKHYLKKK